MSVDEARSGFSNDSPSNLSTKNYLLVGDNAYGYIAAPTTSGDIDTYFMVVKPNTSYTIIATESNPFGSSAVDVNFALLDRYGNVLTFGIDQGTYSGLVATAADTLYYIQVFAASSGFYGLRLGNNSITEANGIGETIFAGNSYAARIDYVSDVDIYNFFGEAGRTYELALVTAIPDLFLDLEYMETYVANLVSNGSGTYRFSPSKSGFYSLHLSSNSFLNTGEYSFSVREVTAIPTYVVSTSQAPTSEGATAIFSIATTNVASGTQLSYALSGLSEEDIVGGLLSGSFTVNAEGFTTISIPIAADKVTEGVETLTVTVGGTSASIQILDTSKQSVVATYMLAPSASSVNEGSSAKFTVTATGVTAGTSAAYTLTGLSPEDVAGGDVSGRVTFDDLGMATISVPIAADGKTEGTESLTVTIGGVASTISVNDTSKAASQYYITASDGIVAEGKVATFTVSAADAVVGTKIAYTVSGASINAKDIGNGKLSGSVSIGADSSAIITVPIAVDKLTEGDEDLTVALTGLGVSETITIEDTSTAVVAAPTYTLTTADSSLKEGEIAEFTLETTGVAAGTKLKYLISGVSAADLTDKKLTGTAEVGEDGTAIISIATAVDSLTEGNETVSVTVSGQKASMALLDENSVKVAESVLQGGDVSLYKGSMGSYVLAAPGLETGDGLEDYIPLKASAIKDYALPKGLAALLSYEDGSYGLISTTGTGAKAVYSEQKFSEDGIAKGKAAKLTASQVITKETTSQTDINGDGVIGDVVNLVLDGDGDANQQDFGLYRLSSGAIVLGEAELSEGDTLESSVVLMASKTKGWTIPAGSTVAGMAITDGGSLEVLTLKGKQYSSQKFDAETGLIKGKAITLKTVQVDAREFYYNLDLTGDGEVSLVGQDATPVGWSN